MREVAGQSDFITERRASRTLSQNVVSGVLVVICEDIGRAVASWGIDGCQKVGWPRAVDEE